MEDRYIVRKSGDETFATIDEIINIFGELEEMRIKYDKLMEEYGILKKAYGFLSQRTFGETNDPPQPPITNPKIKSLFRGGIIDTRCYNIIRRYPIKIKTIADLASIEPIELYRVYNCGFAVIGRISKLLLKYDIVWGNKTPAQMKTMKNQIAREAYNG